MGESIGIGIAAGGFSIALVGAVASLFFRFGNMDRRITESEKDIAEIRSTYIK